MLRIDAMSLPQMTVGGISILTALRNRAVLMASTADEADPRIRARPALTTEL